MDRRQFLRGVAVAIPAVAYARTLPAAAAPATDFLLGRFRIQVEVLPSPPLIPSTTLGSRLRSLGAESPRLAGTRWTALDGRSAQHLYTDAQTCNSYLASTMDGTLTDIKALPHWQPPVTDREWTAGAALVGATERIAEDRLYRPMPPFVIRTDGSRRRRLVAVGVHPTATDSGRVVLADLSAGRIVDLLASEVVPNCSTVCGQPNLEGCQKVLPEYDDWHIRVFDGDRELWSFDASRPRASTGVNASGIELRRVRYQRRPVLSRGNIPILNVSYGENECGCGPSYRDWFGDEACFVAVGPDAGGGLRLASTPPLTIVDDRSDTADEGNYRGLALYATEDSVVLVSETKAAWYRYVSEWRFSRGGDLAPRIAFGATENPCTCLPHTHHAYLRLHLPTVGTPQLVGADGRRRTVARERNLLRDGWSSIALRGRAGPITLRPGPEDGTADDFGQADVWLLRARDEEMDDLVGFTADPVDARAKLDQYLDDESLTGSDLALWYAVHFKHELDCNDHVGHHPRLGPTLTTG